MWCRFRCEGSHLLARRTHLSAWKVSGFFLAGVLIGGVLNCCVDTFWLKGTRHLPDKTWKCTEPNRVIKIPVVTVVSVLEMFVCPVLWLRQAQLFVKCAQQYSGTTFSPQLWAASSDNSVTCAAAVATKRPHTLLQETLDTTCRAFL